MTLLGSEEVPKRSVNQINQYTVWVSKDKRNDGEIFIYSAKLAGSIYFPGSGNQSRFHDLRSGSRCSRWLQFIYLDSFLRQQPVSPTSAFRSRVSKCRSSLRATIRACSGIQVANCFSPSHSALPRRIPSPIYNIYAMSSTNGEISFCSERQPLLTAQAPRQPPEKDSYAKGSRFKIWPTFTTISPRYRYVPLLGCLIVFINESEYFFKQVAVLRAIEAMYCVEFYSTRDPALAQLGKHIPERLCKDHLIQKQLAKTAGLIMFFRMIAAMVGAIPLGQVADTRGRKVVLVMHKVNVVVSNTLWLGICKRFSALRL